MTARYAVIGQPVEHSLSPQVHTAFANAEGQDMRYDKLAAPRRGFANAARVFFESGGSGLNVTAPFKEDAWRWVDRYDEAAAVSGAVNTILVAERTRRGFNTDGVGLLRDLTTNLGWSLVGARVLLLGAGGASRGIVASLLAAGVSALTIANRTRAKAEQLARRFGAVGCGLEEIGAGWDVVVNGTSAGFEHRSPLIASGAVAGALCYDLRYARNGATAFCRWAAAHGARETRDGLGMLVEQAAEAFLLWRGVRPKTAPVLQALRSAK